MWWFWAFFCFIAIAMLAGGARLVITGYKGERVAGASDAVWITALTVPFLLYAVSRSLAASVVWMEAERMVLLQASGVVVAVLTVFALGRMQQRFLLGGLFVSLTLMGLYGVLNHILFESRHVLWMPRYDQYAGRATGSYFCPDHFAGAMELLFCMSAGVLLDRHRRGATVRWLAAGAALLAVWGVLLSKSRGAGITLVVIIAVILVWGFAQWPRPVRWYWRMITVSVVLLATIGALLTHPGYIERFITYGGLHTAGQHEERSLVDDVVYKLQRTCRGRMFGGAWRAWKTAPWLGIGPGMHQHLWPQFAATADGDREQGVWPTLTNHDFHSYEVHSDWLQLLQESGIIGMLLFCLPLAAMIRALWRRIRREQIHWQEAGLSGNGDGGYAWVLCAWLALAAMGFHSLGDFNLQMPGTVWMLALLLGMGEWQNCIRKPEAC
jgi:O-antigen ligase